MEKGPYKLHEDLSTGISARSSGHQPGSCVWEWVLQVHEKNDRWTKQFETQRMLSKEDWKE